MAEAAIWYYTVNGQRCGPVTNAQLKDLAKAGELAGASVWKDGMAQWIPAAKIKGLLPDVAPPPTPVGGPPPIPVAPSGAGLFANLGDSFRVPLWMKAASAVGVFLVLLSLFFPWYKVSGSSQVSMGMGKMGGDFSGGIPGGGFPGGGFPKGGGFPQQGGGRFPGGGFPKGGGFPQQGGGGDFSHSESVSAWSMGFGTLPGSSCSCC